MIELKDVSKIYQIGDERVRALDHATMHIYPHEFVSVIGPSGSGKSPVVYLIDGIDLGAQTGRRHPFRVPVNPFFNEGGKQRAQKR